MKISLLILLTLYSSACSGSKSINATTDSLTSATITQEIPLSTQTVTSTPTLRPSFTATYTATETPEPTQTSTLTATVTSSPSPTYAILRGEVNTPHVSCFYGPHKSYLYKYGLVGGSNLEIIGRNIDTNYIEIRAIGGTNPCWMNSKWMNIKGDLDSVQPIDPLDVELPASPYYGPLSGVSAQRDGSQVTISWNYMYISPGKDSEQFPYLVEAWVCQAGKSVFIPVGTYTNSIELTDETGCKLGSYARVYGVEKHGYTKPVEVKFP